MPTTPKQIEANRRNAAMSTGPRKEDGKAASLKNTMKHGVLSSVVVAQDEDRDAFEDFYQDLFLEFQPQTMVESALVEELALLFWRGRRLVETERRMIDARIQYIEDYEMMILIYEAKEKSTTQIPHQYH